MIKLITYRKLEIEFNTKVKELQQKCPHKQTHWAEHWWAFGHFSGYKVKICNRCRKILEEKPTKKEREEAERKNQEEFMKKYKKILKYEKKK